MKHYLKYLPAVFLLTVFACSAKPVPAQTPAPEKTPVPSASAEPLPEPAPAASEGYAVFEADGFVFELPEDWFVMNAGSSKYFQNGTDPLLFGFSGSDAVFSADGYDETVIRKALEETNLLEEGAVTVGHGQPYDYVSYTYHDYESEICVYHFFHDGQVKVISVWNETGDLEEYEDIISHMLSTLVIR